MPCRRKRTGSWIFCSGGIASWWRTWASWQCSFESATGRSSRRTASSRRCAAAESSVRSQSSRRDSPPSREGLLLYFQDSFSLVVDRLECICMLMVPGKISNLNAKHALNQVIVKPECKWKSWKVISSYGSSGHRSLNPQYSAHVSLNAPAGNMWWVYIVYSSLICKIIVCVSSHWLI